MLFSDLVDEEEPPQSRLNSGEGRTESDKGLNESDSNSIPKSNKV